MNKIINSCLNIINSFYKIFGKFDNRNTVIENILYSYYDNNKKDKEILILLHGFSSNKESLLPIAYNLSNKYRIIIPDLLEHGDTKYLTDDNNKYDIHTQLNILYDFINNIIENKKIHIIGYSIGGLTTVK